MLRRFQFVFNLKIIFPSVVLSLMGATPSFSKSCTDFEKDVAALAVEAKEFQRSARFKEYGFSGRGGFAPWLARMHSLADRPEAKDFFSKYGYGPMSIYQVADEYRTAGELDSFYRSMEADINHGPKCKK
ncbi:hypothetical protein ACFSE0_15650 [Ochrobactrum teleogrylli]|uniref:Lipoprotein n=1 Tax=Ochrobactrum teleogrylli TaxID=2479765 RepID=A0ABY2Y8X0_9HYPH|nr:hypothetical protein [[Ochrobactrum] teleogrylli]TNV16988.1 hypothetical protein FIC94_07400 [[Ochrobactrum] teleogrylli]